MGFDGTPFHLQITAGEPAGVGDGPITGRTILRVPVPIDFIAYGIHLQAFDGNCDPTLNLAFNLSDSVSQEPLYATGLGITSQFEPVPAAMIAGTSGVPMRWPRSRPFYQNSTVELVVEPGAGVTLSRFTVTLMGERVDRIRDPKRRERLCTDPRTSGYTALLFDKLVVESSGTDCVVGPVVRNFLHITTLPYDFVISGISLLITNGVDFEPLPLGEAEIAFTNMDNRAQTSIDFTPTSLYGGSIHGSFASASAVITREVATPLGIDWVIPQQSTIELRGRSVIVPFGGTEMTIYVVLHGRRRPSEDAPIGYPTYQHLNDSLRQPEVVDSPPYNGGRDAFPWVNVAAPGGGRVPFPIPGQLPPTPIPVGPPAGPIPGGRYPIPGGGGGSYPVPGGGGGGSYPVPGGGPMGPGAGPCFRLAPCGPGGRGRRGGKSFVHPGGGGAPMRGG